MATAKMKIILPLVVWTWLHFITTTTGQSFDGIGFGIKREVFFLNLEDGYFGCQVNESTDVLQLFELSKLCDGTPNCYLASDELAKELKCTDDCRKEDGTECQNGACLDNQCYCNDGYGGCSCEVPDENECKYRPCDVFAHCTNTLGSFSCTCFPGYHGDGFHCEDVNECDDPAIAARCVQNAECCNLPSHFLCKCKPGFQGDGEVQCLDIDECQHPNACGQNALCQNTAGNYTCSCPEGFYGNPFDGCVDVDECEHLGACGPGATCSNVVGGRECHCPPGYAGDPYTTGCIDFNECAKTPCGRNALCSNLEGSYRCSCPPGFIGDPKTECSDIQCRSHSDCTPQQACINRKCQNPCLASNPCTNSQDCQVQAHQPVCVKVCQCQGDHDCAHLGQRCDGCNCIDELRDSQCAHCPPGVPCNPLTKACYKVGCTANEDCPISEACIDRACQRPCDVHNPCAQNAVCINTNHGCDCSCQEGYQGNGFVGCAPVADYGPPVCQYNEDCPPNKLCDRLNRRCINPCFEDSCGDNAECIPKNHGATCICLPGYEGNAYVECLGVLGCRRDDECASNEACLNQQCVSPCNCGINAMCDVINHKPQCQCPAGYQGDARVSCQPPSDPCDPNPCGVNALCELDNGNPICFCPKGLTGNPFKNCIPEGDECSPNPCGPNSGCRVVGGNAVCFCLPEFEGTPPQTPCSLPTNPCDPSPCGPNTQCSILANGFAKCTCLPGFLESPNTIRGCIESKNPCEPNPCGPGALCDPHGEPVCYCPYGTNGNPFRSCVIEKPLCSPGPCGVNADCYNTNNEEQCFCRSGFIGDPYTGCRIQPPSPCVPNPCGPGAQCIITPDGNSLCRCPEGMGGDPTGALGCFGYECVVDENCGDHQACISYRCRDPCPGSCGINADCRVEKHHPVCTCHSGLTGNPVIRCFQIPEILPLHDPCMPNPCGLNTICQSISNRAVCSCLPDFHGDPQIGCRPECLINSDCPINKACLDRHCKDPCTQGHLCGVNAFCQVRDHTAACLCLEGFIGDPFLQCIQPPIEDIPKHTNTSIQPCTPSPCGNMECSIYGTQIAICDPCLGPEAVYNPQCRPECLTNVDCPFHQACLRFNCIDPCPGSCGVNAVCSVVSHTPICSCPYGLVGDPFQQCVPVTIDTPKDTCDYPRCGVNADCIEKANGIICVCKHGFFGDPYLACRPECVINPDCPLDKACINAKCSNPCSDVCGVGAQCDVVNHSPICYCPPQHTGDPFVACYKAVIPSLPGLAPVNPCDPSPCGPYSRCFVSHQGYATCSCLPNYQGVAPACKPECISTSECPQTKACINLKCSDPCSGTCGSGAVCTVINHNPICSCPEGLEGNPFLSCRQSPVVEELPSTTEEPINPCVPSPCGQNSICQIKENRPVCSCIANYVGSPPYCRPECMLSQECPQHQACVNEKCIDPCISSCGPNAECHVVGHNPFCSCLSGYEGDAFVGCTKVAVVAVDPCNPSPCGENSQCTVSDGAAKCACIPPYIGNPYSGGCRPECTINSECATHLACLSLHCRDPCLGLCGVNSECSVFNHVPICTCARGLVGDPQTGCRKPPVVERPKPCEPSPCGPNSVCRERNDKAICSCQVGYFGQPPSCRPECLVSSECSSDKACINQRCQDPCPGTCGARSRCQVSNHNPICSCPPNYVGDPFIVCRPEERAEPTPIPTPCIPSPCGPNADCQPVNNRAVCSCLPGMFGVAPNCRPECSIDQDCPLTLACTNQKCKDPCTGSCGFNAECSVVNHRPICSCQSGFEGDPFSGCSPVAVTERPRTPCSPSPCGPNAECREKNGAGACFCATGFEGNPYDSDRGCRRECEVNNDCSSALACVSFKCVDPCPGTCGALAECHVNNHIPTCICPTGFVGDPFFQCRVAPTEPPPEIFPCQPSPCGPNSQCREVNKQAVCSCLPQYIGSPPSCRPECVVNSECQLDKACINQRCGDPCPNTCGLGAQCTTRNHNPICACPPGYTGDPFTRCSPQPPPPPEPVTERPPSCQPSPCGPNSVCKIIGNSPTCSCLPDYIGAPPNCRPECVLSSECGSYLACINQKCKDPCPGSCGSNTVCTVLNHIPICNCAEGFTGDAFTNCHLIPASTKAPELDLCNPSPCGPNSQCNNGVCTCLPEYMGNPYEACRPECVLSAECTRNKACIRNKCVDPCPGTCGQNARCDVINHIPSCSCPDGYTGDPFVNCRVSEPPPPKSQPCNPSPCGPNSQCREVNDQAVCSCLPGYQGSPPGCRPECVVGAECPQDRACINQKCVDPCPGSCGARARCEVRNHSPICSCQEGETGDPFQSCRPIPPEPPVTRLPNPEPCNPSPCGPNSICRPVGENYACSCLQNYIGNPPNCRPECVINTDCPSTLACINSKCKDPCPGSCGENAECHVISHAVSCSCLPEFVGDPFVQCIVKTEPIKPCEPSPCGANAECRERNGAGACICLPDYQGNPYEGCRPECVLSSDCQPNKACIRNKCEDPCPGTCGENAECSVINHVPACTCRPGLTGDAFKLCSPLPVEAVTEEPTNPCVPSPCGPNSQCRVVNSQAVCSCLPEYQGSPPACKPECVVSSECPSNRACHKFKCANPCAGTCGIGARCEVINHNPICSCPSGLTGDPFSRCYELPREPTPRPATNPCVPSPCGLNSECRDIGGQPSCSCKPSYMGVPPNCRPECVVNTDCPSHLACITERCKDPCSGSCGFNAECRVQNHIPICTCAEGFIGNAFTECMVKPAPPPPERADPCNPSPCGQNSLCNNGICSCLSLYQGDPYVGCRPECTMNSDCSPSKNCVNLKCVDPCPGTCGDLAICDVVNHLPICRCPPEYEGDPFVSCRLRPKIPPQPINPCQPSPCGPNSVCKVNNGVAVCSCQQGMIGSAPQCRPECIVSAECSLTQACLNNKCVDPCPGTCGISALCQVVNHNPICSCPSGNTGDPFTRCYPIPVAPRNPQPCQPSPCGPNSVCQVRGESPACSCLEGYVGVPPSCRPECTINPECPSVRACINQKCRDPCPGSCGANAVCSVVNHSPLCSCVPGHTGDPFRGCVPTPPPVLPSKDPCYPSPCGPNAHCRTENDYAICECAPEYHGNPYQGCRPECLSNSDCAANTACINNKCRDPCPGTCGVNAVCTVTNHRPACTCQQGYAGDAFRYCSLVVVEIPKDPCNPSPCGINTVCRTSKDTAICECLPGFFGNANIGGCRPECTISSDCPRNQACVNTKCVDPCPGVCGFKADCNVINHSPVCSCPQPLVGDPFTLCTEPVVKAPEDPCNPSPCKVNGQCRVVNDAATCIYPECVINPDCPRDKACYSQKCQDPCTGACGLNAICQVVNHQSVCTCPPGFTGTPEVQCKYVPPEQPRPKPECTEDAHCSNDKACINTRCQNPCSTVSCGRNADCRAQLHRAVCTCRDGFTGNSQHACVEIGCRSDSDCAPIYSCINRECVDPCSYTSCGINAQCIADGNHKARCYCPETFRGNPLVQCDRPECTRDDECSYNLACRNEQCQNPCNCGQNAICNVISHRAQCSCPPGYIGNPLSSCQVEERAAQPQCKIDSECPSKLACFGGVCKNPCIETKPCGKNAECIVVDSLPLRTMSCMCLPGYVGDADVDCKLAPAPEEPGCKSHQDCAQSDTCINRQCLNACVIGHPCAPTAECEAAHHKALCKCPSPLIGDPLIRCYEQPLQPQPECVHDGECSGDKSCINQHCQDVCLLSNPCGSNAECQTRQHRPTCVCPVGWIGNPQITCYKPECKIDDDCPYNKACISENCLNPCSTISCGRSAECIAQNHRAQCQCPAGTQGDPLLSCITGQCQYNEDCADHEACDRLNRICRPVCDSETCADSAQCLGQNHQPKCICPVGMVGNPFIECKLPAKPACTTDADCPSQLGCINQLCANPCHQGNLCSIEQECRVIDTVPLRTIMCACPSDQIIDDQGLCRPIVREQPQCQQDSDCSDTDKCYRGNCIDACRLDSCGVNAICTAAHHLTQCVCAPGYTGNPRLECTNVPRIPGILPQPECTIDDDCPLDSACKNSFCVNPCRSDKPCGKNAFCSVNRHQAVCRCPEGYIGRPEIECLAPPTAPAIGCTTNSECPLSEFCLNKLCISPCNCGPNADCRVDNHYATCFCKAGYSGNPQTGCFKLGCQSDNECGDDQQCYNSQCVNPCILDDPCARNAECFGRSHKANCRCSSGYSGDPFVRCERLECYSNQDCPSNRACIENRCIDPCSSIANPRCAQNAECYAQNHAAACVCPEHLPEGNPLAYCYATKVADKPLCVYDSDCPSKLACIRDQCVNPCISISPCHPTASCSVIDTTPVRTMACTCREGWVPNDNGECHAIVLPIPPGCSKDDDCPSNGACINRVCRNPCDCGVNAICDVRNHKPICSCKEGFEGNPNIFCRTIGCRIDSECDSGTACINGQCVSPCLVKNPCGTNAECFVNQNAPECKCRSGYRGNPYEKCLVIGCVSNSECPDDRQCINAQCINPCLYDNQCSSRAECLVQNHIALCKCPPGLLGNPYVDCKPESQPECREDGDCPALLACINSKCDNPCSVIQPCQNPAKCQVVNSLPVRTMNCVCPPGYISSGSGTCKPVTAITKAACISDSECPSDRACFNGICRNPCDCGPNAECRIKDHKPICACQPEYEGKPEIGCRSVGCRNDDECSPQHSCINRQCVPVCLPDNKPCGENATCYGNHHRAICDCLPGRIGNPRVACVLVGCRSDSECPSTTACINNECKDVCIAVNPCDKPATCKTFNHISECICPPGTVSDGSMGCLSPELPCTFDHDCQSGLACIGNTCQDTCVTTQPCGINANCKVVDTEPVRTMICECLPGYHGNAAVKCDKGIPAIPADCNRNKGYVINAVGECVCPPNTAPNNNDDCVPCRADKGLRIDERGRCVCALERGFIIDERGNCACHLEYGYRLDSRGNCVREKTSDCETNDDCPDHKYCNLETKTCDNPCATKRCGVYALCNATNHQAICQCITGYSGNPDKYCNGTQAFRTDFPKPDMLVSCLSDGVQVEIVINEQEGFNGVLYVKGHSKDEQCRRVLTLPANSASRTELFKVQFGNCGLIHVNGKASFVLVIQKHPKLVTYKAQAYHIQCVYQTGEQNVTLGFNVSMLTTAGTIANTGPPPTCLMKIVTPTGQEINSAEIGDSLILQVDVQPGSIYGGFARSCVAKTMEDAVENEYLVTDENGCATDPSIFGEWEYNPDTQSLLATFHAFKFPSSDNIRFQCNIRVCFGKCQPVNCRGSDAFGRRKRAVTLENDDDDPNNLLSGQLREEITIQSNAILTLERREERYTDTSLSPDAQRSEDICVSMIGFIIALVITALLALVAVAVAVSCWLMAYRRRPKSTGPLPHPPEFPNPLFTTPEPMAEPRPDYLT